MDNEPVKYVIGGFVSGMMVIIALKLGVIIGLLQQLMK